MSDAIEAFTRVRIDALIQGRPNSSGRFSETADAGREERFGSGRVTARTISARSRVKLGASRFETHRRGMS